MVNTLRTESEMPAYMQYGTVRGTFDHTPGPDDNDWLIEDHGYSDPFVDPNNPNVPSGGLYSTEPVEIPADQRDWIIVESYQIGNSQAGVHKGTWITDVSLEDGTTVAMETLTIAHEGLLLI
jgi:hypothetical protein